MKKTPKKPKRASLDRIEAMSLQGEDTSSYFGKPKRMPPREERKAATNDSIFKINVDLTERFLVELDEIAIFLNISRQAVMKSFLKDGVDRHYLAKQARKA